MSGLAKDTFAADKDRKYQSAARDLSAMGDYKNTLVVWDSGETKPAKLYPQDSVYYLQFKPRNAKDYIIERAKNEQIIILNEAHHQPYHRVFTESLLHDLYKLGYRFFGGETINQHDSVLNERKYPVVFSGTYSKEPRYGNMIRTALQEGYYVFAYEADFDNHAIVSSKEREIQQARHIKSILDTNPKAKIIIHCGFGHLVETELGGDWEKAMAGRLKEYTGIDPFTIDQVELTERSSIEYDDPFFKMINLDYYAVFINQFGKPYNDPPLRDQYDISVYHPRTKWINGRPNWAFEGGKQPYFINDQINIVFPCLVLAYCEGEDISIAVPTDVIELKNKDDKTALALKKGNYTIIIKRDSENDQQIKVKF